MRGICIALLVLSLMTGSNSIESRFANDVVEPTKLGEADAVPAATPKAPSLNSFDSADANGDGCIDKAEFFAAKATVSSSNTGAASPVTCSVNSFLHYEPSRSFEGTVVSFLQQVCNYYNPSSGKRT